MQTTNVIQTSTDMQTKTEKHRVIDSEALQRKILAWGAGLAGFGDVSTGLAPEFIGIPTAISIAVGHPASGSRPGHQVDMFYNYRFDHIDRLLAQIQIKTVNHLKVRGWRCFAIPPDTHRTDHSFAARLFPLFAHKTAATCSGLGWIGKSGLLVTREYGPRVSWATVLTNAPLQVCTKPYIRGNCGKCTACVDNCPSGAIKGHNWVRSEECRPLIDTEACQRQLEENYQRQGDYLCGQCMISCPLGRK